MRGQHHAHPAAGDDFHQLLEELAPGERVQAELVDPVPGQLLVSVVAGFKGPVSWEKLSPLTRYSWARESSTWRVMR
jgi:hypothetical protein